MAAKKSKKPSRPEINKSAFIRANPSLGVADLIAKAKTKGVLLTPGLVYNIRSNDRLKGKTPAAVKTSPKVPQASQKSLDAFIDLVVEHGAKGASELLQEAVTAIKAATRRK